MTFRDTLHEVVSWLERDKRIAYSAIKRQFDLDAEALEDLKDALLYAYPVVDEGRGMVWTGEQTGTTDSQPEPGDSGRPDGKEYSAEAERRQLTVMFCDIAGSTVLSRVLDPEDLREVIRGFQQTAARSIKKFDGHVAQYLGDGILVYFGWPHAHEDDAKRAVLSGLDMLDAIETSLNPELQQDKDISLAVRIGIHTGPVVVGEMGSGEHRENLATGDTVNIAARIEAIAERNTIVISSSTERLVNKALKTGTLGEHMLKGVETPIHLYRVDRSISVSDAIKEGPGRPHFLVGREEEMGLLQRRWSQSKESPGQVVLVCGTAGIGKSVLVDTFESGIRTEGYRCVTFHCSSYHQNSALFPVIVTMDKWLGIEEKEDDQDKLILLEGALRSNNLPVEEFVPPLARLLSIEPDERYPMPRVSPNKQKQLVQDAVLTWIAAEAESAPLCILWEDLHWADPSTLELLDLVVSQIPTMTCLAVMTYRPGFVSPWQNRSHVTQITLNRLERNQSEALVRHLAGGHQLPEDVMHHIIGKTDGVPLFVEELTKVLLDSEMLELRDGEYLLRGSLQSVVVPETLQDSLMARLDQLNAAKELAQLGAVLGREFSYSLIMAISPLDANKTKSGLTQLVDAELLYIRGRPPKATYFFKHALIQDAAYISLLRSKRQRVHHKVAKLLVHEFSETVRNQPELIAHHYTESGAYEDALQYWLMAGQYARQRSAHAEAIAHLHKGLNIIDNLPEEPTRKHHELTFLTTLGPSLIALKGYASPDVRNVYKRARELYTETDESDIIFPVLWGLLGNYIVRAEHHSAYDVGQEFHRLAIKKGDPVYLSAGLALGMPLFCLARFTEARRYLEQGLTHYSIDRHQDYVRMFGADLGVFNRAFCAQTVWQLGYAEQANQYIREAVEIATECEHPFSLAIIHSYAAMTFQWQRDIPACRKHAEQAIELTSEQEFAYYLGWATVLRGWTTAVADHPDQGVDEIHHGLEIIGATNSKRSRPYYLALLAEAYVEAGLIDNACETVQKALSEATEMPEIWWLAELQRLEGEFLLKTSADNAQKARECYAQSIATARQLKARFQELRTTISLARLLADQDQTGEAKILLRQVCDWFSEGLNTPDMKVAKAMLDTL